MYQKEIALNSKLQLINRCVTINTAGQAHTKNQGMKMVTEVTKDYTIVSYN